MLACPDVTREMDSQYTLFMETDFAHCLHDLTTGDDGQIASFNQMLEVAYRNWPVNERVLPPLPHPKRILLKRSVAIDVV
jgi:hypothetical protein